MGESSLEQDAKYIRETLAGNDAAYKQLMEKYVKIAGSIAYSVVGDFHIAADIVQEAFIKVYRKLDTLKNPRTFKAYLAGAVRSSALDWIRKKTSLRRGSPVSFTDYSEDAPDIADDGTAEKMPLSSIERTEEYDKLLEMINELPENYREVFVLKHIEGITYKEISEVLGISLSAVEARLYRARRMLRARLGRDE